jgi:hypothetical protein
MLGGAELVFAVYGKSHQARAPGSASARPGESGRP